MKTKVLTDADKKNRKRNRGGATIWNLVVLSLFATAMSLLVGTMVHWIIGAGSFLIMGILISDMPVSIKAAHFAVPTRFGRRLKRILFEGLNLKAPLIDKVKEEYAYSLKPQTLPIKFTFVTKDRIKLKVEGLIRYQPDPDIPNKETDLCRFVEIEYDTLKNGLNSKVESDLGRLGGVHKWKDFVEKRRSLENYINCILRLTAPPHVNPQKILCSPKMENVIWKEKDEHGDLAWKSKEYKSL